MRKKNKRVSSKNSPRGASRFYASWYGMAWFDMTLVRNVFKKLPVMIGVVAIVYLAVVIKDYDVPAVLPVENVVIEGELYFLAKNDIMHIVNDNIKNGYFTVDLKQLREILLQQPWIKNVSLRRKWPASVVVMVEEHKPLAFWNSDAYISESGGVFKPSVIDSELNLPHLSGPETQHGNVLKFMNVLYKQMALLNYDVKRLELDDRRAWQLVIQNTEDVHAEIVKEEAVKDETVKTKNGIQTINIKLGRFETEKRLQRFVRILPALSAQSEYTKNKIEMIDMRYPNGFSVRMSVNSATAKSDTARSHAAKNHTANNRAARSRAARNNAVAVDNRVKVFTHNVASNVIHIINNKDTQGFVYAHRYATVSMGGA